MNDEFIIYTDINLIELQGVYSDKFNNLKQICRLINSTEEIPQYRLKSILDPWRKPQNKKLIFKSAVHFVFGIVLKK